MWEKRVVTSGVMHNCISKTIGHRTMIIPVFPISADLRIQIYGLLGQVKWFITMLQQFLGNEASRGVQIIYQVNLISENHWNVLQGTAKINCNQDVTYNDFIMKFKLGHRSRWHAQAFRIWNFSNLSTLNGQKVNVWSHTNPNHHISHEYLDSYLWYREKTKFGWKSIPSRYF